jgi:voltage-gated potassium channel
VKTFGLLLSYLAQPARRRNLRVMVVLVAILVAMVAVYTVLFHQLMAAEGQEHSWVTSIYWTLTVMSTLGFGDITFHSDAGRVFSMVVLVSGALFILVLLPFAFIQLIFVPWIEHREASRAPRQLPSSTSGHIVLTTVGPIEDALIARCNRSGVPYVVIVPDLAEALALFDRGYQVLVGDLDDPNTYRAARVGSASLVSTTRNDTSNTNIVFTVRESNARVPIVATASASASVDILELAGCDRVLQLGEMLGEAMAERVLGDDGRSHVVGRFGELLIAEANAAGTPLVSHTIAEAALRSRYRVTAVGVWERGRFRSVGPDTPVTDNTTLILAGSRDQLDTYDAAFATGRDVDTRVIVVGGGRVGRAACRAVERAGLDPVIIERVAERVRDPARYVHGDAAELAVLRQAGIDRASAVLITTHNDDVNVYLTLYCRRLRPRLQVISRANLDRNVTTLHRAGADAVLSYASMGAMALWNTLGLNDTLVVAEGLDVFRVAMPADLAGRTLRQTNVTARTGCTIVAVAHGPVMRTNPDPDDPLPADADLIVIGDAEAEGAFLRRYPSARRLAAPAAAIGPDTGRDRRSPPC